MKKSTRILATTMIAFGLIGSAYAADNHQVTVTVHEISSIGVTGGNITLDITTESGGTPVDATNTACSLTWLTNGASKKVTVATANASPTYVLKVLSTGVSKGTSAGTKTITTSAADLVTAVQRGSGGCGLTYTASATLDQATGSDVHTVTYTITDAS